MIAQLARLDLGVGILPKSIALAEGLHVVQIVRPRLRSRLEFVWPLRTPSNHAASRLIEHTRDRLNPQAAASKLAA